MFIGSIFLKMLKLSCHLRKHLLFYHAVSEGIRENSIKESMQYGNVTEK